MPVPPVGKDPGRNEIAVWWHAARPARGFPTVSFESVKTAPRLAAGGRHRWAHKAPIGPPARTEIDRRRIIMHPPLVPELVAGPGIRVTTVVLLPDALCVTRW